MSIETDISEINSQSIASEEIVRQRMKELPYNSIVWSIANLYQKRESENSFDKLWILSDIFNFRRENAIKKYSHTKKFNSLTEGEFYMKCLICSYETKFFISSKSCFDMLKTPEIRAPTGRKRTNESRTN